MSTIYKSVLSIILSWFLLTNTSYAAKSIEELHEIQKTVPVSVSTFKVQLNSKENLLFKQMKNALSMSANGSELLKTAKHLMYQFGGFTDGSLAHTDVELRIIRISENQNRYESILSFAYELSNVINSERYLTIQNKVKLGTITKGQYVQEILQLEAEAIYWQYLVAKDLRFTIYDVHNLFVGSLDPSFSIDHKLELIAEKLKNSFVGGVSMADFYSKQFDYLVSKRV